MGYILNDQWAAAEEICLKWEREYYFINENFYTLFLKDITDLEAAGITHPDFEKVKQLSIRE